MATGFFNEILNCQNFNCGEGSPNKPNDGVLTAGGDLLIGTGETDPNPEVRKGVLISPDASVTINYNKPNIELTVSSGAGGGPSPNNTQNLGFSYSSPTFTVHASDGTALSPSNKAQVRIQPNGSPGLLTTIEVDANQTFIDATGASTISGNLFGLTTSIAAIQDIPFFLYAIINDSNDSIAFGISRIPNLYQSPNLTYSSKIGSTAASEQWGMFYLNNPTLDDYDQNPCFSIGCFRMRMDASNNWTVQTFNDSDGMNKWFENQFFVYPFGQFGAAAGKWFADNGGTAPAGTGGTVYKITRDGMVKGATAIDNVTTAGVGAVNLIHVFPYASGQGGVCGHGYIHKAAATGNVLSIETDIVPGDNFTTRVRYVTSAANGVALNTDLALTDLWSYSFMFNVKTS